MLTGTRKIPKVAHYLHLGWSEGPGENVVNRMVEAAAGFSSDACRGATSRLQAHFASEPVDDRPGTNRCPAELLVDRHRRSTWTAADRNPLPTHSHH